MKNKILIIGGSGFVGSFLIDAIDYEDEVVNFDKKISQLHSNITIIGNIIDKASIDLVMKDVKLVILLAAEHKDNVKPVKLYYDVNVKGTQNVLESMSDFNVKNIIFTSSVAVYGINKNFPNEESKLDPFNHYGKSKFQAEELIKDWTVKDPNRSGIIIRPTVIFGPRNRGNLYNLLEKIVTKKFVMIGAGKNKKSIAYVENVVSFIEYLMKKQTKGIIIYNYCDKPDLDMNQLVLTIRKISGFDRNFLRIPFWLGMIIGYTFDFFSIIFRKNFSISSVRVKKFCAKTNYNSKKLHSEFSPPYPIREALRKTISSEFIIKN